MSDPVAINEEMGTWERIACRVNRSDVDVLVPADRRLAEFLRDDLGLTGTKTACEVGVCGVCTVLVDGRPISSCIALAVQVDGANVMTVEGLAEREDLRPLLDAFITEGGYQCGFCTSGQIVAAAALLLDETRGPVDDDEARREHMQGNLCRCTGYYGIERALLKADG